jgi:hypothetical protein
METNWKTMSVENKHISEGTPDSCNECPIALAMRDYEPVFDVGREKRHKVNINTLAEDWFAEDVCGAMSHRIIVHPDDSEMVEEFIKEFDATTFDNPHSNDTEDYCEWDEKYRFENFAPFTFRYIVTDWKPTDTNNFI